MSTDQANPSHSNGDIRDQGGGMSAGCSKFPRYHSSSNRNGNLNSDILMSNSSPNASQQQAINDAFPSPPSTSTSSQPNASTNLIANNRLQPPQSKSATTKPIIQTANNTNRPSNGIFNFLFRGGRKSDSQQNFQNYISNEGSITSNAWKMIHKEASSKVRLRALETLSAIAQQRKLQVSTLEGIYGETKDMLDNPLYRQQFLNLIYNITVSQIKEIGLALRLTFFETIRSLGSNNLNLETARWLTALTDSGKVVEPFEVSIAELIADWLEKVVLENTENNAALTSELIQLCTNLIHHQSAFFDDESLSRIAGSCCKRIVRGPGDHLGLCLTLIETIFANCVIQKSVLFLIITTLCFIVCLDVETEKTWNLFNELLTSDFSYATLEYLQDIMRTFVPNSNENRQDVAIQVTRGAVHALAQALWGAKRIEALNCSPCIFLPAFEEAMFTNVLVARQVMNAIKRLVVKYGRMLNIFNWSSLIKLLKSAVNLCGEDVETAVIIKHDLQSIISAVELLHDRKEYAGDIEELYSLLESCVIDRPDSSAISLLEYRIAQLTPETPNWIDKVYRLLKQFLYEGVSLIRREKSVYAMHNFYKKWRLLHEEEILKKIILPVCASMIPNEKEIAIEYYLICVLFDVAKIAKIDSDEPNELYMNILNTIGTVFNNGMNLNNDNDNLEVAACYIGELLDERFAVMNLEMFETVLNIIIRHLELHYVKNGPTGYEVRMRLFETLLLFQCHPINGQMARVLILTPTQFKPIYNPNIIRAGNDTQGQYRWTSICEITTLGLQTETNTETIYRILEFLSGTIEHRYLVYSAGTQQVQNLVNAILGVVNRMEERYPMLPKAKLARYLCPVLGKLVNYTPASDKKICKIIVHLVKSGCPQALMAADSAIQVLPEMALFNRSLLENLAALKPMAQLAIPTIELLHDAADIVQFHAFFTEKQWKIIINLLAPYSNTRQFHPFIVTSVYQTAMKWFLCVPMSMRGPIAAQMFGSFARVNNLYPLQKPSRLSESPEAETSEKSTVKMAAMLMNKEMPEGDSHPNPTALVITPSKKRSNIKKPTGNFHDQISLESEINAATELGHLYLQGLSERNASGDGRQPIYELPFEDPTPLFSTGDTISLETDPIGDFNFKGLNELAQQILTQEYNIQQQDSTKQNNQLTRELLENLSYFIRFFRTKTTESIVASTLNNQQSPSEINENLTEKVVENWVVDGTILTLRVFVRPPEPATFGLHSRRIATISVDRLNSEVGAKANRAAQAIQINRRSMSRDKKRTNTTSTMPSQRNTSITSTPKESDDLLRRRHQSTKASTSSSASPQKISRNVKELSQPPEEMTSGHITPNSDDVFLDCVEEKSPEWIQLVIRHVFGAESYVMRSFSDIPLDFDNALGCANNSDPTSLLLHLRGNHSAVRLLPRDNDLIARSLSFLDTMPSEEMHDVSVIYLREDNHTSMNDVLMTEYGSERFISFVRRLGRPCKTDKTDFCYEHVDLLQKIRFHITTLIPCTTEAECEEKKKMIENSTICVVFNESGTPCKLSQLFRKNDQVALEVTPQDNSSVTINMHAIREVACWCALSRILLPDDQATHVLRKMIVRTQRSYRMCTSINNEESAETLPYLGMLERQRHIHKLRRHGVPEQF